MVYAVYEIPRPEKSSDYWNEKYLKIRIIGYFTNCSKIFPKMRKVGIFLCVVKMWKNISN